MISCIEKWVKGNPLNADELRYEDDLQLLKELAETYYYQQLMEDVFLKSDHYAMVELCPTDEEEETEAARNLRLEAAALGTEGLDRVRKEAEELKRFQDEPDAPDALKALPRLCRADIAEAPDYNECRIEDVDGMTVVRHNFNDAGIAHISRYYDVSFLNLEDFEYLMPLIAIITQTNTTRHSAAEMVQLKDGRLGSIFARPSIIVNDHDGSMKASVHVYTCSLSDGIEFTSEYVDEALHETVFCDRDRLCETLASDYHRTQFVVSNITPHLVAQTRARAHFQRDALLDDAFQGIGFYKFIGRLKKRCENDVEADKALRRLEILCARVFGTKPALTSIAADDETVQRYVAAEKPRALEYAKRASLLLAGITEDEASLDAPSIATIEPIARGDEAFAIQSDSVHCAQAVNVPEAPSRKSGYWSIANSAASLDYLWNEVHVKGGASGAGFRFGNEGVAMCDSFRDSQVNGTLQRFEGVGAWLRSFEPTEEELDGYVIRVAAAYDTPVKAMSRLMSQDYRYLSGVTPEDRQHKRHEIVSCTA